MLSQFVFIHTSRYCLADAYENVAVEGPWFVSPLTREIDAARWLVAFVFFEVLDERLDLDLSFCKRDPRLRSVCRPAVINVAEPHVESERRDVLEIVVFWDFVEVCELVVPACVLSVVVKEKNKNLKTFIKL